jgi:hypothetical protein
MTDNNVFKNDLLEGEKILWTGRPETSVIFTFEDIVIVPLSIFVSYILIIPWALIPFLTGISVESNPALLIPVGTRIQVGLDAVLSGNLNKDLFMLLIGLLLILFSFFMIFGRFLWKAYRKTKTWYAVTDKRVLILTKVFGKRIRMKNIDKVLKMRVSVGKKGMGNINFEGTWGYISLFPEKLSPPNTGLDIFGDSAPSFYDIKDAQKVYDLVESLRKQ